MDQNGHCLCAEHTKKYNPKNIRPAWYVAPEHLKTILFCGRCAGSGERVRGGLVFGESSTKNDLVQFIRQAAYWLSTEELSRKVLIRSNTGQAV